jgi:hypothetical protein
MSVGIRSLLVCALSLLFALGISLPAQATPLAYTSVVTNAGGINGNTITPMTFDGIAEPALPGSLWVTERRVSRGGNTNSGWLFDPGPATVLGIMPFLGATMVAARTAILTDSFNHHPNNDEWIQIQWSTYDPDTIAATDEINTPPISGTINNLNNSTGFTATGWAETADARVFPRSIFVQFLKNGVPVLMAGLPTLNPLPGIFVGGTPVGYNPPGNIGWCGFLAWALCLANQAVNNADFFQIDTVRVSFFMDHTPEPAITMLLPLGLVALGLARRRMHG